MLSQRQASKRATKTLSCLSARNIQRLSSCASNLCNTPAEEVLQSCKLSSKDLKLLWRRCSKVVTERCAITQQVRCSLPGSIARLITAILHIQPSRATRSLQRGSWRRSPTTCASSSQRSAAAVAQDATVLLSPQHPRQRRPQPQLPQLPPQTLLPQLPRLPRLDQKVPVWPGHSHHFQVAPGLQLIHIVPTALMMAAFGRVTLTLFFVIAAHRM
mmetsp:Transcript_31535/g.57300  ORF Transcript_31535/g.57300 Transcript_31535/m.57300 type:complete len:215 (-) Transcript_31535:76-720(-)